MQTRSSIAFNFSDFHGVHDVSVYHGPHYGDDIIVDDAVFIEQSGTTIIVPQDNFDEFLTYLGGWAKAVLP